MKDKECYMKMADELFSKSLLICIKHEDLKAYGELCLSFPELSERYHKKIDEEIKNTGDMVLDKEKKDKMMKIIKEGIQGMGEAKRGE